MSKALTVLNQFKNDEDGAALIEYTVLLGLDAGRRRRDHRPRRHLGQRQVDRPQRGALTDARRGAFDPTAPRAPETESVQLRLSAVFEAAEAAPETSCFEPGGFASVSSGEIVMRKALTVFDQFRNDEDGAALIEYTVLLGIMLVAVVATIGLVGTWVRRPVDRVEHRAVVDPRRAMFDPIAPWTAPAESVAPDA